jgi:hypothetical protein
MLYTTLILFTANHLFSRSAWASDCLVLGCLTYNTQEIRMHIRIMTFPPLREKSSSYPYLLGRSYVCLVISCLFEFEKTYFANCAVTEKWRA